MNYFSGNTSFDDLSKMLEIMGVKNCKFMVNHYNPDFVAKVNNIPSDKAFRMDGFDHDVYTEMVDTCEKDVWFFLREMVKIPGIEGNQRFILNEAAMAAIFCLEHDCSVYINSPRTTYKTTSMLCYMAYKLIFHRCDYANFNIIVKDASTGRQIKHILSEIIKTTLGDFELQLMDDSDSIFDKVNIITIKSQTDLTLKIQSEYNLNLIIDAEVQRLDLLKNLPGLNIFESCVGPAENDMNVYKILTSSYNFRNSMYDNIEGLDGVIYIKKHFYELGFDTEWYMKTCEMLCYDEDLIKREIMLDRC